MRSRKGRRRRRRRKGKYICYVHYVRTLMNEANPTVTFRQMDLKIFWNSLFAWIRVKISRFVLIKIFPSFDFADPFYPSGTPFCAPLKWSDRCSHPWLFIRLPPRCEELSFHSLLSWKLEWKGNSFIWRQWIEAKYHGKDDFSLSDFQFFISLPQCNYLWTDWIHSNSLFIAFSSLYQKNLSFHIIYKLFIKSLAHD